MLLREEDIRFEQRTDDLVVEKLQTEFDTPLKGSASQTAFSFFDTIQILCRPSS
jgi:hypothetical protein